MGFQYDFDKIHGEVETARDLFERMTPAESQESARDAIVAVLTGCLGGLEKICDDPVDPTRSLSMPQP